MCIRDRDEGEDGIPFAENTELRGEILLCPGAVSYTHLMNSLHHFQPAVKRIAQS